MPIQFSIDGEKQLSRRFRGMEIKGKNWKSTFKKIGQDLTGLFGGAVFTTRGSAIGERWKPRADGSISSLLQKTGRMRRGFKFNAKGDSLKIYNIMDYFQYHQSNRPRSNLPRRVMMKIDNKRKSNIMREFQKDSLKKLGYKTIF